MLGSMIPIPNLTGGAAYGGSADNRSANINGAEGGSLRSLRELMMISQGSSENGGATDSWGMNGDSGGLARVSASVDLGGGLLPILIIGGIAALLIWKLS